MLFQLVLNGFVAGSAIALLSLGFSILYSGCRFFAFTYSASYSWAAYAALAAAAYVPRVPAAVAGISVAALVGVALEAILYGPIRRRGEKPLVLMLASIGAYTVLQNMISIAFSDSALSARTGIIREGYLFLGARITGIQIAEVVLASCAILAACLVLRFTALGLHLRAVASDRELALISGIGVRRSVLFGAGIGSALAGVAAVLISLDTGLLPTMGFQALLLAIVACIIGGAGNLLGAVCGGMLLGLLQQISVWKLSTQWQDAIVFFTLILFLVFRPKGIFGGPSSAPAK
jgi:branched-chain amino acid transport system permease protein